MFSAGARRAAVRFLWALALSTALDPTSGIPDSSCPKAIRGQILDAAGQPVAGATVRILRPGLSMDRRDRQTAAWIPPRVVETGEDGSFAAGELSGTEFVVRASAPGHAPTSVGAIPGGAWLTLHLEPGVALGGRVLHADTRRPVAEATVVLCDLESFDFGRDACQSAETDETGGFLFDAAPQGELQLRAQAAGHAVSAVTKVETPLEQGAGVTLELRPGARVQGRVVDEERRPIADARVYVRPLALSLDDLAGIDSGWPDHTDEDGLFSLQGVRSGATYTVHAFRSDLGDAATEPITVATGEDLDHLRVVLPHPAVVTLRLVDEDDSALKEFDLHLRETTADGRGAFDTLDASWIGELDDGRFELRLPGRSGTFDLLLAPDGFVDILSSAVELGPKRVSDLGTLVAIRGLSVAGVVADDAGDPIENATVEASWTGDGSKRVRRTVTDAQGHYAVAGLHEAFVKLEASAAGFLSEGFDAVSPGVKTADFTLRPLGGVSGRLELEEGEVPPAFTIVMHVEAESAAGAPGRYARFPHETTFRSEDGSYRIDDLPAGRYTIEGRASGWATDRKSGIEVSGGKLSEVPTLVLREGLSLQGRVVALADGEELPGTEIEAWPDRGGLFGPDASDRRSAIADEEGMFRVPGLAPGSAVVRARHPNFAPAEQRVELQEGDDDTELIFRLSVGGTLRGTVSAASGDPSSGRRIALNRESNVEIAITDAEGRYELLRMMPGDYSATLLPNTGSRNEMHMKAVAIREGEVTVLDFDEARRISLSGIVYRENQPLSQAEMFFVSSFSLTDFGVAQSDSEGRYSIGLDEPGRYRVLLQTGPSNSWAGASTEIDVPDRDHVILDIHLGSGDGISGTVQDSQRSPLVGAVVSARPDGAAAGESRLLVAATDAAGSYSIQGLPEGTYRVTASAPGHRVGVAYPVEILGGSAAANVDFTLEHGHPLRGRVVDEAGRGLAATAVVAGPAGSVDSWGAASAVTDINGTFQLTAPSAGPIDVTALPGGWAPVRLTGIAPPEGDDQTLVLRAGRGGVLLIRVVGPAGEPRSGVQVSARAVPAFLGSELIQLVRPPAPTDASGSTRIEHVLPWDYEILAQGTSASAIRATVREGAETAVRLEVP
jgi:protocatechuate 3,4-dioxygenase beta subunit